MLVISTDTIIRRKTGSKHHLMVWNSARNEVVKRLLADTCEMCGSHDGVEVHHIRHPKDRNVRGRAAKPAWPR